VPNPHLFAIAKVVCDSCRREGIVKNKVILLALLVVVGVVAIVAMQAQAARNARDIARIHREAEANRVEREEAFRKIDIAAANDLARQELELEKISYEYRRKIGGDPIASETLFTQKKIEIEQRRANSIAEARAKYPERAEGRWRSGRDCNTQK
jgi:hypothetical protein